MPIVKIRHLVTIVSSLEIFLRELACCQSINMANWHAARNFERELVTFNNMKKSSYISSGMPTSHINTGAACQLPLNV
jgi:hypothetical protein